MFPPMAPIKNQFSRGSLRWRVHAVSRVGRVFSIQVKKRDTRSVIGHICCNPRPTTPPPPSTFHHSSPRSCSESHQATFTTGDDVDAGP